MVSKRISCLCILLLFVLGISSTCQAKSVFAIASHGGSEVKAYSIDPNSAITYQATVDQTESFGIGAGALCLWPSVNRMFITYEQNDGVIAWASIKTLDRDPETDKYNPGIGELAGMLVDEDNSLLYALKRQSNELYAFTYSEAENTLIPEPLGTQNDYVELDEITTGGYDIALDEDGSTLMGFPVGRLYVSDYSYGNTKVRYYNTATWNYEGYIELGHPAIGIGLDQTRGYLYAGFFTGTSGQDYLMRYTIGGDPNDSETYLEQDMGAPVMDIAVDEDTGFIYVTLKRSTTNGRVGVVEVYDPTNWISTDPDTLVLWDQETDDDFKTDGPAGIAVGPSYKSEGMYIDKSDDVDGFVLPGDVYHYDITYRPDAADETNVVIVDKLPDGVDFISADPNWGEYFEQPDHKYVWELGDINGGASDSYFELTVQTNEWAEPNGVLINIVSAESDVHYTEAEERTKVSWWGGDVIYIDRNSPGPHIGTSWQTAYRSLADALERADLASDPSVIEIRVANGTYKPGITSGDHFKVPDGVEVYGGYAGYGAADPDERNWKKYETILSGYVGLTGMPPFETVLRNNTVVKMGDGSLLDGVTVEEGNWQGTDGSNVPSTIVNCTIMNNQQRGINCENGDLTVKWCEVAGNGQQGIYHTGNDKTLTIENSKIHNNLFDGVFTFSSNSQIKNSLIYQNGSGSNYYGINLVNPSSNPTIRNNTIVLNVNEGISFSDNSGADVPDVLNCIVYYNGGDTQLAGLNSDIVADFCCIQDCNEVATNSNFNDEPGFVYGDDLTELASLQNFHIAWDSVCVDAGDDDGYTDETDMDGEVRVYGALVDIGADEAYACDGTLSEDDIYNAVDWNADGVVNYEEFAILGAAWQSHDPDDPVCDPGHPGYVSDPNLSDYITEDMKARWNSTCNLDDTGSSVYAIDLADLSVLCDGKEEDDPDIWLWSACWKESQMEMYSMMSGGGESMMMAVPMAMESSFSITSLVQEPVVVYEPDPVSEGKALVEILDIVSEAIKEEPDNFEGLVELKAVLEDWLDEIQNQKY